jgi:hypothetical protein
MPMKPFLLLMFAISSTATATTVLSYDWQTDQLTLSTQVNSGPTYNTDSGSFSGTFSINFSGLGSIDSPVFFLTIPVDFTLFNDGFGFNYGTACLVGAICYNSSVLGTSEDTFLIQYPDSTASSLEPVLVPISLTTSAGAQYHESEVEPFPTSASAAVTVDFGGLVLTDAAGDNITDLVSFSVITPAGIPTPEPGSFVLAGAGFLALAVRRIRRPFARN